MNDERKENTIEKNEINSSEQTEAENTKEDGMPGQENPEVNMKWSYIIMAVGAFLAIYLGASLYYSVHLYQNTYINGVLFSNYVPANVDLALQENGKNYSIVIFGKNGESAVISGDEIGLCYLYSLSAESIKDQQNALLWPVALWKESSYSIDYIITYDGTLLKEALEAVPFLQKENMTAPVNAHIGEYNRELGCYEIVPEVEGTTVDEEKVYELVSGAVMNQQQILRLEDYDCYVRPEIYSDDEELLKDLAYYNKYMLASVTYRFGAEREVIDYTVYGSWIEEQRNGIKIDEDAVEEYLVMLADKYDTYNERMNFTTIDGYIVNLPRDGFGWKMDIEAEKELLINDIKTGAIDVREPVYSCEGATRENDIGDFYIEVNMTDQRVYIIDHGVVIEESDCVTGNMANGSTTPPGIFGLTYKQRNATLRGRDYVSFVRYWMPFNGNIGFHDASWRNLFGGEIYMTSGSHGCINLPTPFAEELYDYVYKDCPIICYYLTDDVIVERPAAEGAPDYILLTDHDSQVVSGNTADDTDTAVSGNTADSTGTVISGNTAETGGISENSVSDGNAL